MHIETRVVNNRKKYYLAHSYREKDKIRKVRVFLGTDLSESEVAGLVTNAQERLTKRWEQLKAINDPYRTVLSPEELNAIKELTAAVKVKLVHMSENDWRRFTEEFTYNTNAIEGSTVSLNEVQNILKQRMWPNRSKEEISETLGVAEAVKYTRATKETFSIELVKKIHKIIFKNSKPFAGKLRQIEVVVTNGSGGVAHRGVPARDLLSHLRRLKLWYDTNKSVYPPFVLAAVIHNQFENIHPFEDGNGRVGRLLLINILLKNDLPPIHIEMENRREYYNTLHSYQEQGNLRPTITLMIKEYKKLWKLRERNYM